MKPIPFPTKPDTKKPEVSEINPTPIPDESNFSKDEPLDTVLTGSEVKDPSLDREQPVDTEMNKDMPNESKLDKEAPQTIPIENCIKLGDELIEIKPTKLKYFRNKMASAYGVLKIVPLNELLAYGKGVIDEKRDADQLLFDFLVAVFDNVEIVRDHYEEMTADDVEQIFKIFGRLNHIDEKEEQQRKNREAQVKH